MAACQRTPPRCMVTGMKQAIAWLGFMLLAVSGWAATGFVSEGKAYRFDTGALRGGLRSQGRSMGLGPVAAGGVGVAAPLGLFSHYRLLDADNRYLPDARDWPSTAVQLTNGAVEVRWTADAQHPFDMRAVYAWAASNILDLSTTVVAHRELRRFEVFVASYFQGFPAAYGYGAGGFVEARQELGDWLAFTRDDAADALLADGRWLRPPHPVTFKPIARYAGALALRRDAASGLVGLVLAPPAECFAVLMPYGAEAHRSLYLSLFGRDFKDGESATARARLVIGRDLSDAQAIELYRTYLKELQP